MTVGASAAGFSHGCQRAAMTVIAGDILVCPMQQEIRLRIVIKQPQVPGNRVVAGTTVVVEHTVV